MQEVKLSPAVRELVEKAREAAEDLRNGLRDRWADWEGNIKPHNKLRYERDMAVVYALEQAIGRVERGE